jgi:hypothetical protein
MKSPGTNWLRIAAAFFAGAVICLIPGKLQAQWSFEYQYQDKFNTYNTETDSYAHSIFWPQGAFPPSEEAYLYYFESGGFQELGFGDYNDEPAMLGYCFPLGSEKLMGAVRGELLLDVRFAYRTDIASGYLQYQISDDGVNWSGPMELVPGRRNIPLESIRGKCYIRFWGTKVLIDNLDVYLESYPADIRVPKDYSTIQQAVNASSDGEIIEVAPGVYSGSGNWDIDFQGKAITVRSEAGPQYTTIDCSSQGHRGFYFHRGEGPDSILRGFTIKGAVIPGSDIPSDSASWSSRSSHPIGGGIYCEFSSPTIIDCVITDCSTELGGGVGSVGGAPVIVDCVIEDCRAGGRGSAGTGGYGAGIGLIRGSDATIINSSITGNVGYYDSRGAGLYCWQSSAELTNCNISYNYAQGDIEGAGLYCGGSPADLILQRCIISHNTARTGGGIFTASGDVSVTNCTIADNELSGSTTSVGGGIHSQSGSVVVSNSIVWFNEGSAVWRDSSSSVSVLYSNIEGGFSGQDNINEDPMFASASSGDYHLQSVLGRYVPNWDDWDTDYSHSPCIDAGDPQDPVGSEPFPNNKRINMGAYGGTSQASKSVGPLIFHVDGSGGSDSNSGLSRDEAFRTIQRAVNGDGGAINGDIVMVWPGVYREEVTFNNKGITLQSAGDAAVIEAPANGIAFSFYYAESSNSILRNFVIRNCGEAAVLCSNASPELINLTITENQFGITNYGDSKPTIKNCILWNNETGDLFVDQYQPIDIIRFSCIQQEDHLDDFAMTSNSNIREDPLFADPGSGDYHLQSRYGRYVPGLDDWVTDSQTSPCINKGDPSMHRGREPDGGRVNMGAYGGTPYASLSSSPIWTEVNDDQQQSIIIQTTVDIEP